MSLARDCENPPWVFTSGDGAGAGERAIFGDAKDSKISRLLSGGNEVFAIGGDVERAGDGFGGSVLERGERSVGHDGEAGERVVTTVSDVDEFARGVDFDV